MNGSCALAAGNLSGAGGHSDDDRHADFLRRAGIEEAYEAYVRASGL
jgi:hypothetical protein